MDIFSTKIYQIIPHDILSRIPLFSSFDVVVACTAVCAFIKLVHMSRSHRRLRTSQLMGPPSASLVYGVGKLIVEAEDQSRIYDAWAQEYGAVFEIPSALGQRKIILYDPKAINHFLAKHPWTYIKTPMMKKIMADGFGTGIFWAEREIHKRQRKSLAPAFGIAAIRKMTPIFYDAVYKAKGSWNALIQSSGEDGAIIDVQTWMNYVSLDTIGIAGFSHDFGALEGKSSPVAEVFDALTSSSSSSTLNVALHFLSFLFPSILRLPTERTRLFWNLTTTMEEISIKLLERMKEEYDTGALGDNEGESIIGLLIKGERAETGLHLSKEEVISQMKYLILAGYETTSITVTWALVELSRHPDIQTKLRQEILEHGSDPTYDELMNGLPYLDAVVHETFRVHGPVHEMMRMASDDDVVPLSEPIRTKSGELIESLAVAKGTLLAVPFAAVNRAVSFWGEDAKTFRPERWLEGPIGGGNESAKAKELQGYRHLLTFSDGPKICLGRNFVVIEFKAILVVLLKNFVFEFRDGPETKVAIGVGLLPRPRLATEVGCSMPLRVKPYMG